MLTVSENGYGKRTDVEDFPCKGRGNRGVIAMTMSDRNGALVGAVQVFDGDDLMLITDQGTLVRTRTDEISLLSRNTQGVKVIRLRDDEHLVGVQRVAEQDVDDVVDDVELSAEAPAGETPAADDADNNSPAAE